MIRRITLNNFMSHVHTVIEPSDGLTVLVGPNNCGKSAVVTALQILCHNDNSTYVIRHGERESSVVVETDDGHVVEWRRKKESPRYIIDGKEFDRLARSGLPPELQAALRMPKVSSEGSTEFDLHFGEQKSPIFLLDKPPSHAAQFFASSSDAGKLVEMQKLHQKKCRDAERDKARLQSESDQLTRELTALEPVGDIEFRIVGAEKDHDAILRLTAKIQTTAAFHAALHAHGREFEYCKAKATALAPLQLPPLLENVQPFAELIQRLEAARFKHQHESTRMKVLVGLSAPPTLYDTDALDGLRHRWKAVFKDLSNARAGLIALDSLRVPPVLSDMKPLSELIAGMSSAHVSIEKLGAEGRLLAALNPPPSLENVDLLNEAIHKLKETHASRDSIAKKSRVLETLPPVPTMDDSAELLRTISVMKQAHRATAYHHAVERCFVEFTTAPEPADVTALAACISEFRRAGDAVVRHDQDVADAVSELSAARAAILKWAETNPVCPTCGGEIIGEKLMAPADSDAGVHRHA